MKFTNKVKLDLKDTIENNDDQLKTSLTRRDFLTLGAAAVTILGVSSCQVAKPVARGDAAVLRDSPQVLSEQTLEVRFAEVDALGDSGIVKKTVRTFNGQVPGPTIRIKPGSAGGQLKIKLANKLPRNPDGDAGNNCPVNINATEHGINTTNLHTHGLHVSPDKDETGTYDADNVFIALLPEDEEPPETCDHDMLWREGEVEFVYDIQPDHTTGTYWYHAHKHGSTARQVANGLFGALIIEEEPDEIPPYIAKAKEQIFFLHSLNDNPYGKKGKLALRNEHGEVNPQISLRPGEVQRWRFINATPDQKFIALELEELAGNAEDLEFYLIAFDGIMLCKRHLVDLGGGIEEPTKNWASLAPGNRADFLVRIKPSAKEAEFNMRSMEYYTPKNEKIPATDLMTIKVEGPITESVWSDDDSLPGPGPGLPDVDEMKKQIFRERSVTFDGGSRINKKKFDGKILMPPMQKGTVEMWTVENTSDGFHTFHIHVNPFFVLDTKYSDGNSLIKGKEEQWMRWQDSIALPPKGSVTFLTKFTDFTGKFVIHCHNLNHEDMGMMHSVEVISPKNSITAKLLRSINGRYMTNGQN